MLAAGVVAGSGGAAVSRTALTITYWPHGRENIGKRLWSLTCTPIGGTHPAARLACSELAAAPTALAPVSRPCSYLLIRGAPLAAVTGTFRGVKVNRLFRPACDKTWPRLHALLTGR